MGIIKEFLEKLAEIPWHTFVATSGLLAGLLIIFLTPPFQGNDENVHFFSVNNFSRGNFSNKIPESLIELSRNHEKFYFTPSQKYTKELWKKTWNSALLNKGNEYTTLVEKRNLIAYVPLMITNLVISQFTNRYIVRLYLGRITALCIYILLAYHALKIIPVYKPSMALVALTPQVIFASSMLNCDYLSFGAIMLFIAVYIRDIIYSPVEKITLKSPIFLAALLVSLIKFPYPLSVWLLIFVPRGVRRNSWPLLLCIFFFALCHICFQINTRIVSSPIDYYPHPIANCPQIDHPENLIGYIILFLQRVKNLLLSPLYMFFLGGSMIGFLGNFCTLLHPFFLVFYFLFGITSLLVTEKISIDVNSVYRYAFILNSLVLAGIIIVVFFIIGVPFDTNIIEGLQGRYFIPALMFLFIATLNKIQYFPPYQTVFFEQVTKIVICVMLTATVITIYQRFYTTGYFFNFYR